MSPRESNRTKKSVTQNVCLRQKDLGTVLTGPADHLPDYWKTWADVTIYLWLLANLAI